MKQHEIKAMLDSGAMASFITPQTVQRINAVRQKANKIMVKGVLDGQTKLVDEAVEIELRYGEWTANVAAYVLPLRGKDLILGLPFTSQFADNIDWKNRKFLQSPKSKDTLEASDSDNDDDISTEQMIERVFAEANELHGSGVMTGYASC